VSLGYKDEFIRAGKYYTIKGNVYIIHRLGKAEREKINTEAQRTPRNTEKEDWKNGRVEYWKNATMRQFDNSTPDSYRGDNGKREYWKNATI
jgi:hypothetical protein